MISTKESVREREPSRFTVKKLPENLTPSWQQYMLKNLMQDFQMSTVQVLEVPYDERTASQIPSVHFEFPTGYHQDFGCERFKLAESLFDHTMLGAGQLASTSVGMCDTDVRMSLYGSVVITGGNSLLQVSIFAIHSINRFYLYSIQYFSINLGLPRTIEPRFITSSTIPSSIETHRRQWVR